MEAKPVTLIGVFQTEPGRQQELLEVLKVGAETVLGQLPGYVSQTHYKSFDGRRVVLHARWRSMQDVEAMRRHPDVAPYFVRLGEFAKVDMTVCEEEVPDETA